MEEIKIYLDRENKVEAGEVLEFEKVMAGETARRKIYIQNVIEYPINIELVLEGENINLSKKIEVIESHKSAELEFEFKPKITLMKPIRAKLKININYLVK